jgi:hypothetical protein
LDFTGDEWFSELEETISSAGAMTLALMQHAHRHGDVSVDELHKTAASLAGSFVNPFTTKVVLGKWSEPELLLAHVEGVSVQDAVERQMPKLRQDMAKLLSTRRTSKLVSSANAGFSLLACLQVLAELDQRCSGEDWKVLLALLSKCGVAVIKVPLVLAIVCLAWFRREIPPWRLAMKTAVSNHLKQTQVFFFVPFPT